MDLCRNVRSRGIAVIVFLVALAATACMHRSVVRTRPQTGDATLVVRRTNVVDVEQGRVRYDQDVFVRGNRIVAVTASGTFAMPVGATLIDGAGKFTIPGLWDMHVHAWDRPIAEPLFIAYGIAGIRDMGASVPAILYRWRIELACSSRERELRDSLARLMVGTKTWADYSPDRERITELARRSRDTPRCDAAFATLARDGVFWTPTMVQGRSAIFLSDSMLLASLPMEFVRPETYWTANLRKQPPAAELRERMRLDHELRDFERMHALGVRFLAGTDLGYPGTIPGASLHDELALMVRAGLSPLAALRAATLNPALYFGARDSLGTIAAGQMADLVVLDGNPLDRIEEEIVLCGSPSREEFLAWSPASPRSLALVPTRKMRQQMRPPVSRQSYSPV